MLQPRRRWMAGWAAICLGLLVSGDGVVSARPAPFTVRLTRIAELDRPTVLATRAGDDLLYMGEKTGRVRALTPDGEVLPGVVLDLSGEVSSGYEQGLVGLAFDPKGDLLYAGITDREGHSRILEFAVAGHQAVPETRREVLFLLQPHDVHNNGQLLFGPDGLLYLGFGDGGWIRPDEHRAQDLGNLYGTILRIDPRPAADRSYRIPPDNPYVGYRDARPEVWLYGLRQPWRFSFDRVTGDLWVGDVGDVTVEEIDFLPAGTSGVNLGWDAFEGSRYRGGPEPADHVLPLFEYRHPEEGCAVIGGYVYRGRVMAELRGYYVFGDLCSGRLTALWQVRGDVYETLDLGVETEFITSLGEDLDGELYVMSLKGGLYRLEPGEPPADR